MYCSESWIWKELPIHYPAKLYAETPKTHLDSYSFQYVNATAIPPQGLLSGKDFIYCRKTASKVFIKVWYNKYAGMLPVTCRVIIILVAKIQSCDFCYRSRFGLVIILSFTHVELFAEISL